VDNDPQKTGRVMTAALPTMTRNGLIEVVTRIGGETMSVASDKTSQQYYFLKVPVIPHDNL